MSKWRVAGASCGRGAARGPPIAAPGSCGAADMTARPALCGRHRGKGSTCLGVGKAVLWGGGGGARQRRPVWPAGWRGHSDGRADGRPDAANHTVVPVGSCFWHVLVEREGSLPRRAVRACNTAQAAIGAVCGYAAARPPLQAAHRRGSVQKLDNGRTSRPRNCRSRRPATTKLMWNLGPLSPRCLRPICVRNGRTYP